MSIAGRLTCPATASKPWTRRGSVAARSQKGAFFQEIAHQIAGQVDADRPVVGVGSGELVTWFCDKCSVAQPGTKERDFVYRPIGSESIKQELRLLSLPIDEERLVDVLVVEADEVDDSSEDEIWWIAGRGYNGPQASVVDLQAVRDAVNSCRNVVVLTRSGVGQRLGGQLPVAIEGDELEWEEIAEEVDDLLVTDAEITRRSNREEANTRGMPDPVIGKTRDGASTMLLDVAFYDGLRLMGEEIPYETLRREIEIIPGVVAAGLFNVDKGRATVHRLLDLKAD